MAWPPAAIDVSLIELAFGLALAYLKICHGGMDAYSGTRIVLKWPGPIRVNPGNALIEHTISA